MTPECNTETDFDQNKRVEEGTGPISVSPDIEETTGVKRYGSTGAPLSESEVLR